MNGTSSDKKAWKPGLVSGVTKENWAILAGQFMKDRSGVGFPLALARVKNRHGEYDATVRQWGAWMAYMKRKGITTWRYMRQRTQEVDPVSGEPNAVWTAPAEWPHLFDAEATVGDDYEAGNRFASGYRPPSIEMASLARRQATVAATKSGMPSRWTRPGGYEPAEETPKPKFIDAEELLRCHEKDSRK